MPASNALKNKKSHKKDTFRAHLMYPETMGYSEKMRYSKEELIKVQKNCDQQYTMKVNRQCITLIYKAMLQLLPDGQTSQVKVDSKREKERLTYENHENSRKLIVRLSVEFLVGPLC
jgi:hypothetical protein